MKHTILILLTSIFISCLCVNTFAEDIDGSISNENGISSEESASEIGEGAREKTNDLFGNDISINSEIEINTPLNIDLSAIQEKLEKSLGSPLSFEWSMKGQTTKSGNSFSATFDSTGKKLINLDVFKTEESQKKLLFTKNIHIFAYSDKTPFIFDESLGEEKVNQYIKKSLENGVYVEKIATLSTDTIEKQDISSLITLDGDKSYITIWGGKDFVFSVISKINAEIQSKKTDKNSKSLQYNIAVISPFNTDVVNSYLRNLLSSKDWIQSILLLSEGSASQIKHSPSNIEELENKLLSSEYEYIKVNTKSRISDFFFISNFINTLSNNGFGTNAIYLIMIIPFLFFGLSAYKHLIGLSPIGSIIPIGLTLLLFQVGIIPATVVIVFILLLNLALSKVTSRYTLLYAPKIAFIITINIVLFLPIITTLINYDLLGVSINDIVFIILFIIISERLITVILSKEFNEYRYNLLNTLLFAFLAYFFLSIGIVQTLIFAYPEIILILIPLNFMIGRFTGLRVSEYFRFKEVIRSIDEEE